MKNMDIYRKVLPFSLQRLLVGVIGILASCIITLTGFFITRGNDDLCVIVTAICGIVGLIAFGLIVKYMGYLLKAGQIAMITRAVTEGSLPQDVVAAGKAEVKARFLTASLYFAIFGGIKAITGQITRGIDGITSSLSKLGGDDSTAGNVLGIIGGLISAFISIVLEYVNYCCLGWVFYNKNQNAFKSTCDGAVIYFQNWKTLLKNAGKVLGLTIASLVVIGGILSGISCLIAGNLFDAASLDAIALEVEGNTLSGSDILYGGAVVVGLLFWGLLHSVFVAPYFLVSVMRSYMDSARTTTIGVDIYGKLCSLSKKFTDMFRRAEEEPAQA